MAERTPISAANRPPSRTSEEITLDEGDPEVRREITVNRTSITTGVGTERMTRFSSWSSLRRAVAVLISKARELKGVREHSKGRQTNGKLITPTLQEPNQASQFLIKTVQREAFADEIKLLEGHMLDHQTVDRKHIRKKKNSLKGSCLYQLDPFVDEDGILRVGGRLRRSALDFVEKHPAVLPKKHHLSELVIRHYHESTHHQGRLITHGAIRQAGYWVISGRGARKRSSLR